MRLLTTHQISNMILLLSPFSVKTRPCNYLRVRHRIGTRAHLLKRQMGRIQRTKVTHRNRMITFNRRRPQRVYKVRSLRPFNRHSNPRPYHISRLATRCIKFTSPRGSTLINSYTALYQLHRRRPYAHTLNVTLRTTRRNVAISSPNNIQRRAHHNPRLKLRFLSLHTTRPNRISTIINNDTTSTKRRQHFLIINHGSRFTTTLVQSHIIPTMIMRDILTHSTRTNFRQTQAMMSTNIGSLAITKASPKTSLITNLRGRRFTPNRNRAPHSHRPSSTTSSSRTLSDIRTSDIPEGSGGQPGQLRL